MSELACGDWTPYKDEKCIKIFDEPGLINYADADQFCQTTAEANLITIGLQENQDFILEFLQSQNVVDNVWLGLKFVNDHYEWTDSTELHYTNWADGSPKNSSEFCVQIQTDDKEFGKWSDVQCIKKNLVMCEKIQLWSQTHLQKQVIELQFSVSESKQTEEKLNGRIKELEASNSDLNTRLTNLEGTVTGISQNPFPVGFIYVQLPNEQSPADIWSWMVWEDITANYAGVFFRAEGGGSEAFGGVQEENSPRLAHIQKFVGVPSIDDVWMGAPGEASAVVDSAASGALDQGLQFTLTGGEVRPRNMAVRIWRRNE